MEKSCENEIAYTTGKRHAGAPGLLKITEESDKTGGRGRLVVFASVESSDRDNEKIVKILAETTAKQYFNALTESNEFAFEHALGRANITLKDILLAKPKSWLAKMHLAIMAVSGGEVHLTGVGQIRAFLVHHEHIVEILSNDGYENGMASAGRRTSMNGKRLNPVKLFSHVVSGQIGPSDAVVLVNEPVLDYLSQERIRKTASEYEAPAAVARFQELLQLAPPTKQFGIICAKRMVKKQAAPSPFSISGEYLPPKEKIAPAEAAVKEESKDYEYLRPSQTRLLERGGQRLAGLLKTAAVWAQKALGRMAQYGGQTLTLVLNAVSKGLVRLQTGIKKLPALLATGGKTTISIVRDPNARRYYFDKLRVYQEALVKKSGAYGKSLPERIKNRWQMLPPKQKIALVAALTLLLILIVSVAARARAIAKKNYEQNYQNLVASIRQKSDQAEAALIYKDVALARAEIQTARALLVQLPQKSKGEKTRREELGERIRQLADKTEKKESLGALAPTATITTYPPEMADASAWLIALSDRLFYLGGPGPLLAEINVKKGLAIPLPWPATAKVKPRFALPFDEKNIIIFAEGKTVLFNLTEETVKEKPLALPPNTASVSSYFKNIYALAPGEHKLWSFREAAGVFSKPRNWLKQDYNLENITDIAIDGSIWLLEKGGNVRFLENGVETRHIQGQFSEPTGDGAKIFILPNFIHLYIFDPKGKRIIKLTKEGELAMQYTSPQLENARAFTVDEQEKNIFFAESDKIYRIPLK